MSPETTIREQAYEPVPTSEEYFAFPLTPGQTAMLPKGLDSREDPRFNGAFRMNLDGAVDPSLLERSLREIAQRHEIFRTVFRMAGSEVQQVVHPDSTLALTTVDLRKFSGERLAAEIDDICLKEAQTGFDLTKAPPLRVILLQLENTKFMLVLTLHQIICDGWSIGVLMEELSRIYTAYAKGQSSPLEVVSFQYGDYVVWQQETVARPEVQAQLEYWKNRLANCTQIAVDPDYRTSSESIQSDIVSQLLPRELTEQVRALAQAQNTTFFVVAMATCATLLYRYTGRTDVALRTPLAGRTRVELETLIGQFANQVIVRSDLSGGITFGGVVARVRDRVWEALANQDAPFETVIHHVAGESVNPNDLFRVNFVCQREYGRSGPFEFRLNDVRMTTLPSKSQGALYDLNFFLVEREAGWRLSLEYRTELYSKETAENLLKHFQELLAIVASNSQVKISELALSDAEALPEREQPNPPSSVAGDSEATAGGHMQDLQALPASFAQERFWTLSQVDPKNPAFHMPVRLRLTGKVSVLLLEKSFRLLISRHETLRTTFSEIDGELMQIIHNESPFTLKVINLEESPKHERASLLEAGVQSLLREPFDLSALPLFRTALFRLGPDEHIVAFSIHHSIADAWSIQVFQRELWMAYENLLENDGFSFKPLDIHYGDFSVWQRESITSEATQEHLDFWMKSLAGELPVLNFPTDRSPSQLTSPKSSVETLLLPEELSQGLKQLAQAHDTTLYVVTLACFAILLSRASEAPDVIVGSPVANRRIETEPLIGPFAGPVALRLGLSRDPTLRDFLLSIRDTTVESLEHTELPFEMLLERLSVRPVAGRSPLFQFYFFCQAAFLQFRKLQDLTITPLPTTSVGVPFEIQLAVIERNEGIRAELEYNANLFDKSTIEEWLRYYQTLLKSITVDPLKTISSLPAPPYSAPSITKDKSDSTAGSTAAESFATRHQAGEQQSRPVTWTAAGADLSKTAEDSLTGELRSLWKSALNISEVELHDNFFLLGGRSLVAAKLIAKINKKYSLKLGLATFFNCPTIAELAALIRGHASQDIPSSIVAVQPEGTSPPLFVIHGVGGNVLNFYDLAKLLGSKQPVYGVEAQSLQAGADPLTTLEDLAAYYVRDVRKVQPEGPYNFLGYSYGGFVAFEMARQLQSANQKVELLGMLDTPVWRHDFHEESSTIGKIGKQLMAVWSPFFHRLRPCTPMEIFDGVKSTVLRTFYTLATSKGRVIPPKLRSVYHINSYAAVNYVPKTYDGVVTMLRASREKGPRDLGWSKFATQPVRVFEVPGAHLQILSNENLPRVVKSLQKCLTS